jgi:uncharacterized protein (DUF1697 family)
MGRQVALLRGINLGSHNRVGMAQLQELIRDLGYDGVRTHLQSGNVVYTAESVTPQQAQQDIEAQLADRLGLKVPVLVRTRDELAAIIARDPLGAVAADPAKYLVAFLAATPDPELVRAVDPAEFEPDLFRIADREIYLWCPNGVQRSKLTNAFWDRRLRVTTTARNWNTVTKLLTLADTAR